MARKYLSDLEKFRKNGINIKSVSIEVKEKPKFIYANLDGFTYASDLLSILGKKLRGLFKLRLVSNSLNNKIVKVGSGKEQLYDVQLRVTDFEKIIQRTKSSRTKLNREFLEEKFSEIFPRQFPETKIYKSNSLNKFIKNISNVNDLTDDDISSITNLYKKLKDTNLIGEDFQSISKEKMVFENKILNQILSEMITGLNSNKNEGHWQKFFENYLLFLNDGYTRLFPQQIVSFFSEQNKKPDFLLLGTNNYLDVLEIKLPSTPLVEKLKGSQSRNNYIWSKEMCVAISQVENYLHEMNKNMGIIQTKLRTEMKFQTVDSRIIRPRGFIVAGKSNLLEPEDDDIPFTKKRDDFRLLCDSLKNITVILYDDYINKLTNNLKFLENSQKLFKNKKEN